MSTSGSQAHPARESVRHIGDGYFRKLLEEDLRGVVVHRDWRPLFVNQAYARILGYESPDQLQTLGSLQKLVAGQDITRVSGYYQARRIGGTAPIHYEYRAVRKDGSLIEVACADRLVDWVGGTAVCSTINDITDQKRTETALRDSEERYRKLYEHHPVICFLLELNGNIQSVNPLGAEQLGYTSDELAGGSFLASIHDEDRDLVRGMLEKVINNAGEHHQWEVRRRRKDRQHIWVRETARIMGGAGGGLVIFVVSENISDARRLADELTYQVNHDPVTGLSNRQNFEHHLDTCLARTSQTSSSHAMCYLDIDKFRVINDTFGHTVGDMVLRDLSETLKATVRKRDVFVRLGSDQFGFLLEHCSLQNARRVAGEIRRAVNEFRFVWQDQSIGITASIGVIPIKDKTQSAAKIISIADAACHLAKDRGGDRVHVYAHNDAELMARHDEMRWVFRINSALEEDRFRLAYQNIVPVNGENHGMHYEMLIRMVDEDGELVRPNLFLPAAERYGLVGHIDRWVIDSTFSWLICHPEHLQDLHLCCINVSGRSLGDEDFLKFIIKRFQDIDLHPRNICFEITETAAITHFDTGSRFIEALRGIGVRFALDDFGSGLSSFNYLKHLPVDYIKIDGGLVRDIADNPMAYAIVKSIHEIGRSMGKRTVAEFVENRAIFEKLSEIGVDYAQGYAFGRPRAFENILNEAGDRLESPAANESAKNAR